MLCIVCQYFKAPYTMDKARLMIAHVLSTWPADSLPPMVRGHNTANARLPVARPSSTPPPPSQEEADEIESRVTAARTRMETRTKNEGLTFPLDDLASIEAVRDLFLRQRARAGF